MKLLVQSLGRITEAEVDVRPLTVFIGENNTNKTWTAHALFKILERLRVYPRQRARAAESDQQIADVIAARAAEIVRRASGVQAEVRFDVGRGELVGALPNEVDFWVAHPQWMSALGFAPGPDARVTLRLTRQELSLGVASRLRIGLTAKPYRLDTELSVDGVPEPRRTTDYGGPEASTDLEQKVSEALEDLLFGWRRRVRVLPVEREHLAQVFSWLVSRDVRIPMPRALVDFCYMLNELRTGEQPGPPTGELSTALHRILGGNVRFIGPERDLVFVPSEVDPAQAIPVRASASLTKSLAGLDVFLWSAGPGDILLIDEPEMNAHPGAQVALVELLALMIRAGMQLVIVTHSPYIVDHLSTLLEASRLSDAQRAALAGELALGIPGAYVRPDEVAVWHFGPDGRVQSVLDRDACSIDWSTFASVSDRESVTLNRIVEQAEAPGSRNV